MVSRRTLVTGAASGIGRAVAERLAAGGDRVACLDVSEDAVADVARGLGNDAIAVTADVRVEEQVAGAVTEAQERLGGLDLVVNAAGVGSFAHATELELVEWNRIVGVNLTGTFLVCKHTLPGLVASRGCIVNVASTAGLTGRAYGTAYAASKAGVVMLTRSLAIEFGDRGVRVNCVCPGAVNTPLIGAFGYPEGANDRLKSRGPVFDRMAEPDEIAQGVEHLAAATYTTGASLVIDGGSLA